MTALGWFFLGFLAFPGSLTVGAALGWLLIRYLLRPPRQSVGHNMMRTGLVEDRERLL